MLEKYIHMHGSVHPPAELRNYPRNRPKACLHRLAQQRVPRARQVIGTLQRPMFRHRVCEKRDHHVSDKNAYEAPVKWSSSQCQRSRSMFPARTGTRARDMTTRNFVTEARKRRDALTDAIRRVRRDIKVATKSQDLAAAAGAAAIVVHAKNCLPRVRDTAVVLYLTHDDAGVTAKNFVEESLTRKWGTTADAEEFLNHIRDLAATVNFDDASTASWWTRRRADADRYMRERNLHDWIDVQNTRRGVAPTTRAIFARDEAADVDHGPAHPLRERALQAALSRRQVQWTRRFMRRWSLRRGTLQVGSGLPTDEAAQKADEKKRFFFHDRGPKNRSRAHFCGPVSEAKKWPPIGGRKSAQ